MATFDIPLVPICTSLLSYRQNAEALGGWIGQHIVDRRIAVHLISGPYLANLQRAKR